jgi:hypothetical protein
MAKQKQPGLGTRGLEQRLKTPPMLISLDDVDGFLAQHCL